MATNPMKIRATNKDGVTEVKVLVSHEMETGQRKDASGATVTVEMSTSFMRASSGRVTAHGVCLHRTATLAFCEAEVRDADGALCAKAKGTFKFWRKPVSAE